MSQKYQVIARKYRPQAFCDVVGQEAVVTTLKNAIRFDKVAHAYLFCGSRGVGKTTLARLFAKALNCQQLSPEGEPCNQCASCLEISSGQSLDVIEIDGASNRGIDDIRQINETVGYAPSLGKYKIYIIDEVHMLTKEAFNALLKTLEEPPERAKFFFATTESHKVLPTIISRCQRFDLARIQPALIIGKLQQIAIDLKREADADALGLIASFSEGSLRDAESLFDQILCFANGPITAPIVRSSLGLVPEEFFLKLDRAFADCRLAAAFELVDELFQSGKDLAHFVEQLIEHYRRLVLAKTLGEKALIPETTSRIYSQSQALYILDLLIHAESQFQKSALQRVSLESILLQIIRSKNRIPVEVLVRRLSELEEGIKKENSGDMLPQPMQETSQSEPISEPVKAQMTPTPTPEEIKAPAPIQEASSPEPISEPVKAQTTPTPTPEEIKAPAPIQEAASPEPISEPVKAQTTSTPTPEEIKAPAPIQEEAQPKPILEPVPFNPYTPQNTPPKPTVPKPVVQGEAPLKKPGNIQEEVQKRNKVHPSRYDTLMRFAAVELEGTFKNN